MRLQPAACSQVGAAGGGLCFLQGLLHPYCVPPRGGLGLGAWELPRGRRAPHLQPRRGLPGPAPRCRVSTERPRKSHEASAGEGP